MSLAKGVDLTSTSSFEGVVSAMCGRMLGVIYQLCIALYTFGTTIAFLVIIGDQLYSGWQVFLKIFHMYNRSVKYIHKYI